MSIELTPFDPLDFLQSEVEIAAFLEAAQEEDDSLHLTPAEREAHLQHVYEIVARARTANADRAARS